VKNILSKCYCVTFSVDSLIGTRNIVKVEQYLEPPTTSNANFGYTSGWQWTVVNTRTKYIYFSWTGYSRYF